MSNFFEQELRKLFADGAVIHDPVFVGRACLGSLDRNRQVTSNGSSIHTLMGPAWNGSQTR